MTGKNVDLPNRQVTAGQTAGLSENSERPADLTRRIGFRLEAKRTAEPPSHCVTEEKRQVNGRSNNTPPPAETRVHTNQGHPGSASTCPHCGTPTTLSRAGHPTLCFPCTLTDLNTTWEDIRSRTRVNEKRAAKRQAGGRIDGANLA